MYQKTLWPLFLTQQLVVARKWAREPASQAMLANTKARRISALRLNPAQPWNSGHSPANLFDIWNRSSQMRTYSDIPGQA